MARVERKLDLDQMQATRSNSSKVGGQTIPNLDQVGNLDWVGSTVWPGLKTRVWYSSSMEIPRQKFQVITISGMGIIANNCDHLTKSQKASKIGPSLRGQLGTEGPSQSGTIVAWLGEARITSQRGTSFQRNWKKVPRQTCLKKRPVKPRCSSLFLSSNLGS